ncbi:MAG: hypothetical protein KGD64_00740 [Candidatus Heimdallarchaeota archaeon]|nr:hypothetical protein [Candidatus Heimdallarchaeota archaeon]
MKKSKIIFLIMGIVLLTLVISALTFYFIYTSNIPTNDNINVTVIINYGSLKQVNQEEHNLTVTKGSSALQAFTNVVTLDLVNYTFGIYIVGVNGYPEQSPDYWAFYYFDHSLVEWVYAEVGVDNYYLDDGNMIKLEYTG